MVDSDVVAFPICEANDESYWSLGRLDAVESYWRERNWVKWRTMDVRAVLVLLCTGLSDRQVAKDRVWHE